MVGEEKTFRGKTGGKRELRPDAGRSQKIKKEVTETGWALRSRLLPSPEKTKEGGSRIGERS